MTVAADSSSYESQLAVLRTFRTCDVADALQALGQADGGFIPNLTMLSPGYKANGVVAVGPAYTVKFHPRDLAVVPANIVDKTRTHWIDDATKGCVVVVEQADGGANAIMGGVISARMSSIGISGVVVDGQVRDLEEHRAVNLPVFAKGSSVLCPTTKNIVVGETVSIQGKLISPGDLVIADVDGIVHFKPELLSEIVTRVPKIMEIENKVRDAVLSGQSVTETHRVYKPHLTK